MRLTILGASSDIAQALAYRFAGELTQLHLLARQVDRMVPMQKDLQIRFPSLVVELEEMALSPFQADQWQNLSQKTDLLICAIGYLGQHDKAQQQAAESRQIIEANFAGLVPILDIFAAEMADREQGGIIGISSVAGERGRQSNYFYGSAKAGFTAYLSGLRNWLFHRNVHVLTVLPGFVDTRMTQGLSLPPLLTSQPPQLADEVYRAWKNRRNVLYVMPRWRWIMWIIRNIPEAIFKRLKL
ncbi:MAG: SDR family oxidoreductase [Bacteroidota bacterium]